MTNVKVPGLVGDVYEYLCGLPGVDTGLALGAALDVVARAATPSEQFLVPTLGAREDVAKLGDLDYGTILFGPEGDCRHVIMEADRVLAGVEAPVKESPFSVSRKVALKSRISAWTKREAPAWLPEPGTWVDFSLLVGASGIHRKVTRLPPYDVPASLTIALRSIVAIDGPVLIRLRPDAEQGLREATVQAVRHALATETSAGPALKRWMLVLATLAIGVNPRAPVITDDLLPVALTLLGGHSMIVSSFQPGAGRAQIAH